MYDILYDTFCSVNADHLPLVVLVRVGYNPALAEIARRAINETLSDVSSLGAIAPLQA